MSLYQDRDDILTDIIYYIIGVLHWIIKKPRKYILRGFSFIISTQSCWSSSQRVAWIAAAAPIPDDVIT